MRGTVHPLVVLAGLLAAATGLALVAWPGTTGGPRTRGVPAAARMRWTDGDTRAYAFSVDVTAEIAERRIPRHVIRQRYAGTLHMRVFGRSPEVLVGFQVEGLEVVVEGDTAHDPVGPVDGPPFWVRFDPSGDIREVVFHEGTSADTRRILEETVRTFQCVVPPGAGERWSTSELHATGRYAADYALTPRGDVHKRKTRYEGDRIGVERSGATFTLSEESWLARASVRDRITVRSGETEARCRSVASLAPLPKDGVRTPDALRVTHAEAFFLVARHREAPPPEEAPDAAPDYTAADVRRTVLALNASDGGSAKLLRKLSREIASDPALIAVALESLEADGTTEATAAGIVNALGMAGTKEADAALARMVRDPERHHANRLRAVIALGFSGDPGEPVMESLWATADERGDRAQRELSNTALLALGTTTGTLAKRGSGAYAQHRSRLVDRVRGASDREEKAIVLKALGNTRDLSASPEIARHLDDPELGVRKASAYALRLMKDPGVADRLAQRLDAEPDVEVRHAIAASLHEQGAATPRALELARVQLETETDESTRFELVGFLADHAPGDPAVRATFAKVLRVERSGRIRKKLGTVLYVRNETQRRDG